MAEPERTYWRGLNGIRGVAILLVVLSHTAVFVGTTGGQLGVIAFFVLSGFLITVRLIDEQRETCSISLSAFFRRRVRRLLPALLLYVAASSLILSVLIRGYPAWTASWPSLLYVANYAQIAGVDPLHNLHAWSLSVEEHFYFIWPVLFLFVPRFRQPRPLGLLVIGLIGWRVFAEYLNPDWAYRATDSNAFALALGCLIAVMYRNGLRFRPPARSAELSVALLVLLSSWPFREYALFHPRGWLPIVGACLAGLAIFDVIHRSDSPFDARWLGYVGTVSYGWYLWHAPFLFNTSFNDNVWTRVTVSAVTFCIAMISWHLVERPILWSGRQRSMDPPAKSDHPLQTMG